MHSLWLHAFYLGVTVRRLLNKANSLGQTNASLRSVLSAGDLRRSRRLTSPGIAALTSSSTAIRLQIVHLSEGNQLHLKGVLAV
jgi:hypothetical protein